MELELGEVSDVVSHLLSGLNGSLHQPLPDEREGRGRREGRGGEGREKRGGEGRIGGKDGRDRREGGEGRKLRRGR